MDTWLILALISVITVSIATILERVLMKDEDSDPIGYTIVFLFLLAGLIFGYSLLTGKFALPQHDLSLALRVGIAAVLWAGATVFSFKAIKFLTAGEVTILTASSAVVSILLSLFFLHETFSLSLVLGAILVLLAIVIIQTEKLSFNSRQGIVFALLSALCAGIAVVIDATILEHYEVFSYLAVNSFLPGVVLVLLFPRKLRSAFSIIQSSKIKLMFVFTSFYAVQAATYYMSYQSGAPLSHLAPIGKSSIVLTVILGVLFLGERKFLLKKLFAASLVTIGVVLLG